jgi:hypothetical protein
VKKKKPWGSVTEMKLAFEEYGRQGGKIGGKARAEKLSPARRVEIAEKAAATSARVRSKKARAKDKKRGKKHE